MIKLNNKNITYVALADSNNSVKGVKEIWYADSSNSVKLVYRRKDALIEGEDYEKYHWLDGDGSAYMQISQTSRTDFNINLTYKLSNVYKQMLYGSFYSTSGGWKGNMLTWGETDGIANKILLRINTNNGNNYINLGAQNVDVVHTIKVVDGRCYFDDVDRGVCPGYSIYNYDKPFLLFNGYNVNTITESNASDASISKFSIEGYCNLIPCKLLKPVPKWLDANGIRRQVGECGMIDLVSGKFYGNVNSVGTFTVENYYERKEWLCGDGSAYIDVPRSNEVTDVIHFKLDASNSGLEGIRGIFGNLNLGIGGKNTIHFVKYNSNLMSCRAFNSDNEVRPVRYNVMDVDILIDSVKVNSDTYELDRDLTALEGYSMPIFSRRRINADLTTNITDEIIKASLAYFKIDDVLNLIPCTLTIDLPASMDANNIARTKGTCGMWDLVSDRFYGNVANSGTFKAVNLAEGVDYEVHQWLKTICPVNTTMMTLSIGSQNFNWEVKIEQLGNISYIRSDGYSYFTATDAAKIVYIWDIPNKVTIFSAQTARTEGMIVNISSTSESLTFNGEIIPKYGFQNVEYRITNNINGVRDAITYTSSITIDGIERYIPVKLLHSIPSKYDANGIARQAGECGMYDTVNDVFYGNVASSGTFTVSDDN